MAYTDIDKSDDYFNTKLYTGTGATQSITGVGFQPDFVWIKDRDTSQHHRLADVVRGVKKNIKSDLTDAENTTDSNNGLQSFDSDGFTLTQDSSDHGYNANGSSQVSWNWLADNTSGSSNTDGSITSTVSANTTSGFSIVSFTGDQSSAQTIGHGLGVAPKMIIFKNRDDTQNWCVYHENVGATKFLELNSTAAESSSSTRFNNTAPTSLLFSVGVAGETNRTGDGIIAYCFAEKKGFSKFGKYTGNGSTDGTFVYTGFKPAFVMIKPSSISGESWKMYDNKRNTFNVVEKALNANDTGGDNSSSNNNIDFLSNGFKLRTSDTRQNGNGATNIYMAFAENPFVTSTGVPGLAR